MYPHVSMHPHTRTKAHTQTDTGTHKHRATSAYLPKTTGREITEDDKVLDGKVERTLNGDL